MLTFQRTIPTLVYRDIPAAHDFLVNVFGFAPGGVCRNPEGQSIHGEVRVGETTIWLHREIADHELLSPLGSVRGSGLVVFVDNVDAHFERVRSAGARVDGAPADQPYGQREYGVRDIEGHRWWFVAPIATPASV